jgi:uncharacterized protein (TIGR02453 family)
MAFRGFPSEAISFFEGLELDNTKAYWTANKDVYERAVKGPMEEFIASVDERYRPMRMFRPYRDVRFSPDKTPYKTHCAAVGEREGGAAYYLSISSAGLYAGSGYWHMASDQLARFREMVDADKTGEELVRVIGALEKKGLELGSIEALKTAPRGYAKDHPRVDLLRRKGLASGRSFPVAAWLATAKAKDRIEQTWSASEQLNNWLDTNVGPSEMAPDDEHRMR